VPQGEGGRSIFGIKAKLFLAFSAMAGFTISAAAIAWFAFVAIERSVERITAGSIPAMAVSLRLAEKSAEIAAAAPALMASADQVERVLAQTRLEERSKELAGLTQELEATGIESENVEALAEIQEQITAGLVALNAAVEERLRLNEQRKTASAGMAAAHGQLVEVLEPLVDDAVFNLIISGEDLTAQSTEAITGLVEGGVGAIHQLLTVNAEVNLAAGLLAEAANALDPVLIQPIRERFIATAATVERSMGELSDFAAREALQQALDTLLGLGSGEDNIFDLRERELRAIASARKTLELKRERMAETLKAAHGALLEILTPIVDDATFDLVIDAEDITAQNAEAITGLIDGGVTTLQVLLTLLAEGNLAAGLLAEAANTSDRALIQPLRERFIAAAAKIREQLDGLSGAIDGGDITEKADHLVAFGVGDDGIFSLRERELRHIETADDRLQAARASSIRLGDRVAELVTAAQSGGDQAALHAGQAISDGELVLLMITVMSVAGATLIVLLYVAPRVVRPLERITTAMTELAAGDTSVDIPARERRDEIGRMAQALGVFRDTAIEVQRSNLKEIEETRRRLTDAIESISEAFSLYDSDDRLVICNDKFRQLYPEIADEITPGTSFETIARYAAEHGYVKGAEGRVEDWLEERLARRHAPGEPQMQQRGDGRWILVSERKTEDGGTVGVYSDITEIKRAEQELAVKEAQLWLALDNMPGGIVFIDRDRNYVLFNPQYGALHDYPDGLLKVGGSLLDELRFQARRGDYGPGDPDELIADMHAPFDSAESINYARTMPSGRTLQLRSAPTPEGGYVTIATDITERKRSEAALEEAHEIIKDQRDRMEDELSIGREIQMSMIPLVFPPFPDHDEFSVFAALEPAREVGGDFYDYYFIDEERFCFCIGDVSGKGVPAALFMAMAKTLIKSRADDDRSTASILTHVNEELSVDNQSCMFVTIFAGILNIRSGDLIYTNAGHNPPYLKRNDGALQCLDQRHGPVVGAVEGMVYAEGRDTMAPGDLLLLYTDGVTEAMDVDDRLFSEQRLEELLTSMDADDADKVVDNTVAAVKAFEGEAEQADDITVLALTYHGSPEGALIAERRIVIKNHLPEIVAVNEKFETFAEEFGVPRPIAMKFGIIFEEVLNNVISYAYHDDGDHDIEVRMELVGERLIVIITDDGVPFNPLSVATPRTDLALEDREVGGIGIHLVRNLVDDVSYHRRIDRNVLTLVSHLQQKDSAA
jgi:serine phosphatase RsbU (regulator of sigma subunit)/anti-sigma regulatory factor (Ser/Thr protein kinase)/phosphoglycerate-specific signal transduction histidine kinase